MAKAPSNTNKTVKLTGGPSGAGGIITGTGTSAKAGDVVNMDRWLANHLVHAGLAEEYTSRGGK